MYVHQSVQIPLSLLSADAAAVVAACTDTMAAYSSGKLKEMLAAVGYQI